MLNFLTGVIKALAGFAFAFMAGVNRQKAKDSEDDLEAASESDKFFHRIRTDADERKRLHDKFR